MGATQSAVPAGANQTAGHDQHGITIVNPTPGQQAHENQIILPHRVPPILTINKQQIDPERHYKQLDHHNWLDLVAILNDFATARADMVATRQSQLQDRITYGDNHVTRFTESYVNDKHKALARMNEDCRRVEEINKLLHKCTIQSELCVDMLNKLNFLLPEGHKLEPLEIN